MSERKSSEFAVMVQRYNPDYWLDAVNVLGVLKKAGLVRKEGAIDLEDDDVIAAYVAAMQGNHITQIEMRRALPKLLTHIKTWYPPAGELASIIVDMRPSVFTIDDPVNTIDEQGNVRLGSRQLCELAGKPYLECDDPAVIAAEKRRIKGIESLPHGAASSLEMLEAAKTSTPVVSGPDVTEEVRAEVIRNQAEAAKNAR